MTITNKEHKVIAHILKFVDAHYSKTQASIKHNVKLLKAVRELRTKLDDQFYNNPKQEEKSPYYGWNTTRGLPEFLLNDMYNIVLESDKIVIPIQPGLINIPKK